MGKRSNAANLGMGKRNGEKSCMMGKFTSKMGKFLWIHYVKTIAGQLTKHRARQLQKISPFTIGKR